MKAALASASMAKTSAPRRLHRRIQTRVQTTATSATPGSSVPANGSSVNELVISPAEATVAMLKGALRGARALRVPGSMTRAVVRPVAVPKNTRSSTSISPWFSGRLPGFVAGMRSHAPDQRRPGLDPKRGTYDTSTIQLHAIESGSLPQLVAGHEDGQPVTAAAL